MKDRISAIIIDPEKVNHNYDDVTLGYAEEWRESGFTLKVVKDASNILKVVGENRGVDSIITIGDVDCTELNKLPYLYRKKWSHFSEFDAKSIALNIIATFMLNINRKNEPKLFSIFTCTFNTPYNDIKRLYNSLCRQTYDNWNWWIIDDSKTNDTYNNLKSLNDPRITVIRNASNHGCIGFNKHMAAMCCDGDYLVEVDHDDELTPDCLEKLHECFTKSGADFVYSDALEIIDGADIYYGEDFSYKQGTYRTEEVNGEMHNIAVTCGAITERTIRGIHAAPNHVRCWEKNFYHRIGGHNTELSVMDDYDLLVRTFLNGRMAKVNKTLYIQHQGASRANGRGGTATGARFKEIQRCNYILRWKYDAAIHQRIEDLGFVDYVWDDEKKCSDLSKDYDPENTSVMDIMIL